MHKSNVFPLFAKQRKIVKIICNTNYIDHTDNPYSKLNMLQFPDIVKYFTEIFMLKDFQSTLPSSLKNIST